MANDVTITGLEQLFRKLGQAGATNVLEPPMRRAVLRLQRRMATYPPPPTNSRYVRGRGMANKQGVVSRYTSEKLGSRWTTQVTRNIGGLVGKIGNNVSYVRYVQSKRDQANIHRGRWETDEGALQKETPAIVADFKGAIDRALER